MTTSFSRESAKIYAFPTRVRITADGRREAAKTSADLLAQRLPEHAFGGGWYHEAAVRDADRSRKP